MSYHWTDGDRRFQADVDDMVQDLAPADLPNLAEALEERRLLLDHDAGRVAAELRARAADGLLFRPLTAGRSAGFAAEDDAFPW